MRKLFCILSAFCLTMAISATDLTGHRVYINPGHGSWGPNDRPQATISYPNLSSTGMPDTCGFYESNTNLWKTTELARKLREAGAYVIESRVACGPWPYAKVNGQYPDYTYDNYKNLPNYEQYNRPLLEIADEAEANNMDYFISVHSNAATDGNTVNYLAMFYRGKGDGTYVIPGAKERCETSWPYVFACRANDQLEPTTFDSKDKTSHILADIDFYKDQYDATLPSTGATYTGYLGVLHHGVPGFLVEGYFHTYQPGRHRALNPDYCKEEGLRYYRGIKAFFGADPETKGYILGTVKDQHEHFTHALYNYAPGTNDQWKPLNGAHVSLFKDGVEVASYTVDNNYNGLFFFPDLEPGTYKIMATCEGYKDLHRSQQVVEVKANETTYPFLFLEATDYVDPTAQFVDYPDPAQPSYAAVPSQFNMAPVDTVDYMISIKGTVKRTIQHADSTFVLSHEADGTAHIYCINNTTGVIDTISTNGIIPVDPENAGDYLALSDIAITCDNKIVGVNYMRCQYDASSVDAGQKQGTTRFYLWEDFFADPQVWFTSQVSSNSLRSDQGLTLAVSGMSSECTIVITGVHRTKGGVRMSVFNVVNNEFASYMYVGNTLDSKAPFNETVSGTDFRMILSPRGEKKDFIMDAGKINPTEFRLGAQNTDVTVLGSVATDLIDVEYNGASYFRYGGHSMMVAPYAVEGKLAGLKLLDIEEGLDKAVVVKTVGTDLAETVEATYAAASAFVAGAELYLYLFVDGKVYSFSTKDVEQPIVARIGAYDLNSEVVGDVLNVSFNATHNAKATAINFYQEGQYVGQVAIAPAVEGLNEAAINLNDIPGYTATATTWAVEITGEPVPGMGKIAEITDSAFTAVCGVVDAQPESPNFGKYYVVDNSKTDHTGLYLFNRDLTLVNTTPYACGAEAWGTPKRVAIAPDGFVFVPDYSDDHSGIFVADPTDLTKVTPFFPGTRNSAGVISNNGIELGGSSAGINFYKTGAETKLIMFNQDYGTSLGEIMVYHVGNADGTIAHSWDTVPSEIYGKGANLAGLVNKDGQPILTDYGFFCSTLRYAPNNNSYASSFRYYDFNSKCQVSSADANIVAHLDGSNGAALALSADQKYLVAQNGAAEGNGAFVVFEVTWTDGVPSLTYVRTLKHDLGNVQQLSFDYAGNLVAVAPYHIAVYTMPDAHNTTVVPAKAALAFSKPFSGSVEGIEVDKTEINLIKGETATVVASVKPDVATEKTVTWTSDNEAVATVADGVITAVATGEATITVTTKEGNFTAVILVSVTNPVTGITLDNHEMAIKVGEQAKLVASVNPSDADEPTVMWTVSNADVLSVSAGMITALQAGTATVYATTFEGGFRDSCIVSVINPVTGVSLDTTAIALKMDSTFTLMATIAPADATNRNITWASSDEEVATVTPANNLSALITALTVGTANITVTTEDGNFTATCVVTVESADGLLQVYVLDTNAPMYDVLGREVKADYKGVIIQNGHKFLNK